MSVSAEGKFLYSVGREGAAALGYDSVITESAPSEFFESFCGVGNPFSLGQISRGSAILDIGCGAGFDLFVASRLAGEQGRVVGTDLTGEMVLKARANLLAADVANFEVRAVDSETLPFVDDVFDLAISNGVINLSPDKEALFREIYRVLKPGGDFRFADVMRESELPADLAASADAWSQ